MLHDRASRAERERTAVRLRLAAAALGATLLILGTTPEREPAAVALVAYLAGAILLRYAIPRFPGRPFSAIGVALDVGFASVLVSTLPSAEPAWALFAFAIGNAAHRFGAWGAVAATAASIASYDVVLGARASQTQASDLWPIQVLLGVGLLCAELVYVTAQAAREQTDLRGFVLAQRDIVSARSTDELLARLVTHTTLALGADGAWIRVRDARGGDSLRHRRGVAPRTTAEDVMAGRIEVALDDRTTLVALLRTPDAHVESFVRDLGDEARATFASLDQRDAQQRAIELLLRITESLRALESETVASAVLARIVMTAVTLGGAATVLRRSDGAVIAGDALAPELIAAARETHPPALLGGDGSAAHGSMGEVAIASAGAGHALVLVSSAGEITQIHLRALDTIGRVAGGYLSRISERDTLAQERSELRTFADRLQDQLREREDMLASTMHELRTPLTSVTAYGQLISKNLQSALQQLAQLDRLIGDLRHDPTHALTLSEIDLVRAARDAAQRHRLVSETIVAVSAVGAGPFRVEADVGRLGQVLDNLLGNALKFSPKGSEIEINVRRAADTVVLSVTDEGVGLSATDLERVFERYYRAATSGTEIPGLGIGLAVSRDIVIAHGGRIWAESDGVGHGATFTIALPALSAVASKAG